MCERLDEIDIADISEPFGFLITKGFLFSSSSDNKTVPSLKPTKMAFSPVKGSIEVEIFLPFPRASCLTQPPVLSKNFFSLLLVKYGYHDALQRLTYLDFFFRPERKGQGRDFLRFLHLAFQL